MLHIISAPLFLGRPEVLILNAVEQQLGTLGLPYKIYGATVHANPDGSSVYDDKIAAHVYSGSAVEVLNNLQSGDTILWVDGWATSFPIVATYCAANRLRVYNYGIYHSSPHIQSDYLYGSSWASSYASHIESHFDGILCATNYMAQFVKGKAYVTGLPVPQDCKSGNKPDKPRVVFSHRWASDKNPQQLIKLAEACKNEPELGDFVILTPNLDKAISLSFELPNLTNCKVVHCPTRQHYLEELGASTHVWSMPELETFGYSTLEGILSGLVPIMSDHPCYMELYDYTPIIDFDIDQQKALLANRDIGQSQGLGLKNANFYNHSASNIVDVLLNGGEKYVYCNN